MRACAKSRLRVLSVLVRMVTGLDISFASKNSIASEDSQRTQKLMRKEVPLRPKTIERASRPEIGCIQNSLRCLLSIAQHIPTATCILVQLIKYITKKLVHTYLPFSASFLKLLSMRTHRRIRLWTI